MMHRTSPARRRIAAVALAALLLLPVAVDARQAPGASGDGDPVRLTLQEAIDRAERHNPSYLRTTNDLERNLLEHRQQWLSVLPQPQFRLLDTNMGWSRTTISEDNFGEPLERDVVQTVQTSRSTQRVGFSLSLNMNDFIGFGQREAVAEGREITAFTQRHGLRADVSQAFLDVQERESALELEEELLEAARVNRDLADRLYELALRDRIELVSLELELATQEQALEESRAGLESARLSLRNLIGDPDLGAFELVPAEFTHFDPELLDPDALVRTANTASPRIQQAELAIENQERAMTSTRAQWLPTLNFNWGTSRQDFVRGSEAFFDPSPGGDWDRSMSLSVSFPDLGQYFNRQNTQRLNEIGVRNSRESLREVRGELEQEIRGLVNALRNSAASVRIQEHRADLAGQQLELARERYRSGRQTYLELQNAQTQAAQAGRQVIAARFALERARISLERSLGMPIERMLELAGEG